MKKLSFAIACLLTISLHAETPTEDIPLQKVKLQVPEKFKSFFKDEKEFFLPKGFTISVFSAGLINPRFFAWSPSGVLHVASINNKCIYALPDADNDGIADTNRIVLSGLDRPHSLAFYQGKMFVAEPARVQKYSDSNNDGMYELPERFIDSLHTGGKQDHFTRTILFDSLNNYVYVGVGASCDACRDTDSLRAVILRFKTDGTERKIFASGLRNAAGLALEPLTGKLWATVADRNNFEKIPEEPVTSIREGGFYGWPIAYGNKQWMPFESAQYKEMFPLTALDTQRVNTMEVADVLLQAHTTPLGIHFYTGGKFPKEYQNTGFIAVHSSNQLPHPIGHNIIRIRKNVATNSWFKADFLNGFLGDTVTDYWGRPCGLTEDKDGNIYFSSDVGVEAVYKISYDPKLSADDFKNISSVLKVSAAPNIISRGENSFTISYSLPESGILKIALYDALGNLLKTVYNANELAGEYQLPVHLTENISAGMIFYKVELHSKSGFKTMAGKVIVQ